MATPAVPIEIRDQRDSDRLLRVAWHPAERTVVISQWRHGVCVATTPLALHEVPQLITHLVDALGEAARQPPTGPAEPPSARSVAGDVVSLVRARFRKRERAPIVPIRSS